MAGTSKRSDKGDSTKEGHGDGLYYSLISFLAVWSILLHLLFCWKGVQEGKPLTCLSWQIFPAWSGTLWVEGNLCPSWEQPEWSSWSAEQDKGSRKPVAKTESGKLPEKKWKDFSKNQMHPTYVEFGTAQKGSENHWAESNIVRKKNRGIWLQILWFLMYFTQRILDLQYHFTISLLKWLLSCVSISTSAMMESLLGVCGVL